jgi:hypothetical protein
LFSYLEVSGVNGRGDTPAAAAAAASELELLNERNAKGKDEAGGMSPLVSRVDRGGVDGAGVRLFTVCE